MSSRRRFRRPVISRLTVAWFGAFAVLATLGGVFVYSITTSDGPGRIALKVDDVEVLARANIPKPVEERLSAPESGGLRLEPPYQSEAIAAGGPEIMEPEVEGEDSVDILPYPNEDAFFAEGPDEKYSPDDFVITIDGKPQGATPVQVASIERKSVTPITEPIPDLLRSTPLGKVPRISPDGRKALNVYAKPYRGDASKPRIAVIVGGLGLNTALTERAIDELPPEVSLSFAPYAKDLEFWARKARLAGHEVLIELPMEGYGPNQQALGSAALLTSRTTEENLQRLDWLMSRFGGYFAATNYLGAKFSTDEASLKPVLQKLREAGVAYIDDTGAAQKAANGTSATVASVSRMIPPAADEDGRNAVKRELKALEELAKKEGSALGKTYAYAATLDEMIEWTSGLEEKGFSAAPASSVLRARTATR